MIRLLISVAFALAVATSAEAMSPAPLHEPDTMITQIPTSAQPTNRATFPIRYESMVSACCAPPPGPPTANPQRPPSPLSRATFPVRYEEFTTVSACRVLPPRSADHKSTTSAQPTNRATFPVRYESMVSACCAPPPTMSADATTVGVRNGTKVYALSTTETLKPQGKFVPR